MRQAPLGTNVNNMHRTFQVKDLYSYRDIDIQKTEVMKTILNLYVLDVV